MAGAVVAQSKLLHRMVVKACYGLLLPVRLEILLGLLGLTSVTACCCLPPVTACWARSPVIF